MAIFKKKTEEEKEKEEEKRIKKQFEDSPVGKAKMAFNEGQRYFQTIFPIEKVGRTTLAVLGHTMETKVKDIGDPIGIIITDIEKLGWELFQAGFVFRQTNQDSRDKFLMSGQQVAITGQTLGIYLFKRKK